MEPKIQELYNQYSQAGYSIHKAWRLMEREGFDSPEYRQAMQSLYEGTAVDTKKKSQDESTSVSSSEVVSTEPTSGTPQTQQPETGGSAYPVNEWDAAVESLFPTPLNVPSYQNEGPPNRYRSEAAGSYRINPTSLLNDDPDVDLDRILLSMQARTFDDFVRSTASPVQAVVQKAGEVYKGFLPENLLERNMPQGGMAIANYDAVLTDLATAYVLDEKTNANLDNGMGIDEALMQNEKWMSKVAGTSFEDYWGRGISKDRARAFFDKSYRGVMKDIEKKRQELEIQYLNEHFGTALVNALPEKYNERGEDGKLSDRSRANLAALEKQLQKRIGVGMDLSGDMVVGNRSMLNVSYAPGAPYGVVSGEFAERLNSSFETIWNGLSYVGMKGYTGFMSSISDDMVLDPELGMVNFYDSKMQEYERQYSLSDVEHEELMSRMNEYQRGISESLLNGDFSNAVEQSFLMTADGVPYLIPMLASRYLGMSGSAAVSSVLGVAVEAERIRDDYSFDTFIKDGKEYTYYEAAEMAGTWDLDKIKKDFTVETDYWSRTGYLSAVGAGEFAVNYRLSKAMMGGYAKGMQGELSNWFKGYMYGQRVAFTETSASTAASMFLRGVAEAEATGATPDFNQIANDAIEMTLGTAPMTALTHTVGSAKRAMKGTSRSPHLIPMNAEELSKLDAMVQEYQRKLAGSRDPRFIREANQVIHNARTKQGVLRQQSENYMEFLRRNNESDFVEVSDITMAIDRLKMNYENTNDPNLKMQIKENASGLLTRLDEIYQSHSAEFDKFQGVVRGVREREDTRESRGKTREQEQLEQMEPVQERTDTDVPPIETLNPTLSPHAKRNDRMAETRYIGQRAKEFWNKWFKSNGGITNKSVEEVVRSQERLTSAWIDELTFDAKMWRGLLKDVRSQGGGGRRLGKNEMRLVQESMMDALEGRIPMDHDSLKPLTQSQRDQLQYFREHIDGLSEQLIATLESQPAGSPEMQAARAQLIEKIRSNKGVYLTRSYEIFSDGGKRLDMLLRDYNQMPADIKKAYNDAVNYISDSFDMVTDIPMTKADRQAKARTDLNNYLLSLKEKKNTPFFNAMGAMDAPFLKARNNELPPEITALLGRITDPMNSYINTSAKLNSYLANARWQNELAMVLNETGLSRTGKEFEGMDSPMGKMVKLKSDSPEWMPLFETYVPSSFKQSFDNLMPLKSIDNDAYRTLVGLTAKVKVGKTVFAPTTTARNLVSGVFIGAANGHLPFMTGIEGTLNAAQQAWGAHGKYKSSETWRLERRKLIEMGVLSDGANSGELMAVLNDSMKGDVQRIIRGGGKTGISEMAQKLYAFGDDFYKVNGYYQERQSFIDSGMSVVDAETKAAQRIRDGYPTYSKISRGAKEVRRFPFTGSFVSFPYEMYRTTTNNVKFAAEDFAAGRTEMAVKRTMGLLASLTSAYALSEYSMDQLGLTDEDDAAIKKLGPEWQKLSALIYLGEENGSPYFMDASYMLPHETVVKPIKALLGSNPDDEGYMDNVISSLQEVANPYVSQDVTMRFFTSVFSNESETGAPIYDEIPGKSRLESALEQPDKVVVQWLKTVAPGFVGNATEFIRAGAVEKTLETLNGEPLPNGHPLEEAQDIFYEYFPQRTKWKEYTIQDAAYALLGARITYLPVDVAGQAKIHDWNMYAKNKKYQSFGKFAKQPELASLEDINEAVSDYTSDHFEMVENIQSIVDVCVRLNLSKQELNTMLEEANIKADDIGYYMKNKYLPPPFITDEQVEALIQRETWMKSVDNEQRKEWTRTVHKNAAEFNRSIKNVIVMRAQQLGLNQSEIEELLNYAEQGGQNEED